MTLGFSGTITVGNKLKEIESEVKFTTTPMADWRESNPLRVENTFKSTILSRDVADWLGRDVLGVEQLRMFARKFAKHGEIVFISCHAGRAFIASPSHVGGLAYHLDQQKFNDLFLRATGESIWYWAKPSGGTIINRDILSVGEKGQLGLGYRHLIPQLERVTKMRP